MISALLLKTHFGELNVETDDFTETRTMDFRKDALIISGLNISTLGYQLELQANLPTNTVRGFEKYLLDEPHSFERGDVKEIVEKFNLSKYFSKSIAIHFSPEDSEAIMIAIAPAYDDKRYFSLNIWDDKAESIDDSYSWDIKVEADNDILVEALKCICTLAKATHNGKLQGFIKKMNMING